MIPSILCLVPPSVERLGLSPPFQTQIHDSKLTPLNLSTAGSSQVLHLLFRAAVPSPSLVQTYPQFAHLRFCTWCSLVQILQNPTSTETLSQNSALQLPATLRYKPIHIHNALISNTTLAEL